MECLQRARGNLRILQAFRLFSIIERLDMTNERRSFRHSKHKNDSILIFRAVVMQRFHEYGGLE